MRAQHLFVAIVRAGAVLLSLGVAASLLGVVASWSDLDDDRVLAVVTSALAVLVLVGLYAVAPGLSRALVEEDGPQGGEGDAPTEPVAAGVRRVGFALLSCAALLLCVPQAAALVDAVHGGHDLVSWGRFPATGLYLLAAALFAWAGRRPREGRP